MKPLAPFILALLLAGCASAPATVHWHKDGATAEQATQAEAAARLEAQQQIPMTSAVWTDQMAIQNERKRFVHNYMLSHGWQPAP